MQSLMEWFNSTVSLKNNLKKQVARINYISKGNSKEAYRMDTLLGCLKRIWVLSQLSYLVLLWASVSLPEDWKGRPHREGPQMHKILWH